MLHFEHLSTYLAVLNGHSGGGRGVNMIVPRLVHQIAGGVGLYIHLQGGAGILLPEANFSLFAMVATSRLFFAHGLGSLISVEFPQRMVIVVQAFHMVWSPAQSPRPPSRLRQVQEERHSAKLSTQQENPQALEAPSATKTTSSLPPKNA